MITAEFLKQFCAYEDSKYILARPVVTTINGKDYTFATDGHRIMIVDGIVDGCETGKGPNIASFLIERQGVPVNTKALQVFLECGKPTTEPCRDCRGTRKVDHRCDCQYCSRTRQDDCGCEGRRLVKRGYLGTAMFNRCLLADMVADIEDGTVTLYVPDSEAPIHLFASDRHILVMPMRDTLTPEERRTLPIFEVLEHAQ